MYPWCSIRAIECPQGADHSKPLIAKTQEKVRYQPLIEIPGFSKLCRSADHSLHKLETCANFTIRAKSFANQGRRCYLNCFAAFFVA